jgi:hypothetical protein
MNMKNLRRLIPSLVLGLTIAVAGVSFAQSPNQAGIDDKHSCCCMTSGCCGDSCQMMKKDGMKNHAASADKEGCCDCCGDSCQMMKKDGMNHAASADKEGCCCGDSCQMKDGAKTSSATAASDKHECCGDSCNMKHMKTEKP